MADFTFELDHNLILVPVTLCGLSGRINAKFILDTGAAYTIIDHSLVEDLGYSAKNGTRISTVSSATGKERGYIIKIAKFVAFNKEIKSFEVACHDLLDQGVEGLLGMSFLKNFDFCIINSNQTIQI